ncbi:MAG: hypothetical protein ACJ8EQ_01735 [Sphingomicrobium sp.]
MAKTCPACSVTTGNNRAKFCSECGTSFAKRDNASALKEARDFVVDTAGEAADQLKEAARHPATKKIAGGAALGGAAGALLPILTVGVGAALVGGLVAYKQLTKK